MKYGMAIVVLALMLPATGAFAILNGAVDTAHPAVGVVVDESGTVMNSAVLIDPSWVLTSASFATECTQGYFLVGVDWANPDEVYPFSAVYPHSEYDPDPPANNIALIRLTLPVSGTSPLPRLVDPGPAVGSSVQFVGYGMAAPGDNNTLRRSCTNVVGARDATTFETSYNGAGPWVGDQGGPGLLMVSGTPYVAGIVSWGTEDGLGVTNSTRVSSYAAFIQGVMANNPPASAPEGAPGVRILAVAPDPFCSGTEISFVQPTPGSCRLSVFDVRGREVAVLADGWFGTGLHRARWNGRSDSGSEMPSGLYLVSFRRAGQAESRKVLLAR